MIPSIRRRLLASLLPATFGIWLITSLISYFDIRHDVQTQWDEQLAHTGRVLLALSLHNRLKTSIAIHQTTTTDHLMSKVSWQTPLNLEKKHAFQIWRDNSFLVLRSENAPDTPMTTQRAGFTTTEWEGEQWRIFTLHSDDNSINVHVGENAKVRGHLVNIIALRTIVPLMISLPILAWLIWYGIGRSMLPLNRVAHEIRYRRSSDLHPVDDSLVPIEAKDITDAINLLFTRLKDTLENERRFTADAAHELRTPLAALKTHAEIALQAKTAEAQQKSLRQTIRGVNRATHLVEQLLTLARLDPDTALAHTKRADLFIIGESVLSEEAPIALEKNIEISLLGTRGKFIAGNIDAIRVLMRNLVDNAIRYTPENGEVQVIVSREANNIKLSIADSGPGIPEKDREKVFKRFFRRLGTKSSGSGLGLSIVSRVVEMHRLDIHLLTSAMNGLQIDVIFQAADE